MVENELPGHEGNIVGRGHVAGCGQAGTVDKVSVLHTQLLGPLVHLLDKGALTARQILRHSHGGVIA